MRSRQVLHLLLMLASAAPVQAQIFSQPLSPRQANYKIQAVLDDSAKTLHGALVLDWQNPSQDFIPDLQFHLYYNAFKNARSTLIRENLGEAPWAKDNGWGWIEVTALEVRGVPLMDSLHYISPDDGNPDDQTVLQVMLPKPVQPGEKITVTMKFEAKIPRNERRTGWWRDDFFLMVHWFPKIGVYETPGMRFVPAGAPHGRWNCHQFHNQTEFYADFGVYDVEITLPPQYAVGTTGIIVRERENRDGTKTVFAHAEDVHEFAWVADSEVIDTTESWENLRTGQRVNIRLFLQPGHEIARKAYFEAAKFTLQYFDDWLGPKAYPYPILTIVDPPAGSGAGGMEYPNLITGGLFYPTRRLFGERIHDVELVTIHELGHQYWFGIVANNEFEEALLDEGMNTYSENRIGAAMFGERNSLANVLGLHASMEAVRRGGYVLGEGQHDATLTEFTYAARNSRTFAYNKWSLAMKTLDHLIGREKFDNIFRTYYARWKFKHPCRNDFVAVASEVAGEDLSWFFDQIIDGDGVVDYGIAQLTSVPAARFARGTGEPQAAKSDSPAADSTAGGKTTADTTQFYSKIVIRRIGEVKLPVEVLIGFADGSQVLENWDGQARSREFTYTRPARATRVVIDPGYKIPLDVNYLNNSRTPAEPQFMRKSLWKWLFWMQSLLAFFSAMS